MKPSEANTLYEILNIDRHASPEEIDNAFRKQAFIWHPDKNLYGYMNAEAEFKLLMNAYCTLSDPVRKRAYDRGHPSKKRSSPKFAKKSEGRLKIYRARKRKMINKMLNRNNRRFKFYNSLCKYAICVMIVFGGLSLCSLSFQNINPLSYLSLILFNGSLVSYMISKKEMVEIQKVNQILAIKLYNHVDQQ